MKLQRNLYVYRWQITVILVVLLLVIGVPKIISSFTPTVKMVTAMRDLEIGTVLKAEDMEVRNVAKAVIPEGASSHKDLFVGMIVNSFVPANSILSAKQVNQPGIMAHIPADRVVSSVNIGQNSSIRAGDKVDLIGSGDTSIWLAKRSTIMQVQNDERATVILVAVTEPEAKLIAEASPSHTITAILVH
jgi:Flp pilus assembly protein CpaB